MPTVLVLGGYGLIGSACCRALGESGFRVIGAGRFRKAADVSGIDAQWIIRDVADLEVEDWRGILADVDVVVNTAGALQDGPRDDLEAIHAKMLERLCAAAPENLRIVQISAAGVSLDASTEFFRSKARGDAHVQTAACDWVILRPTLVLAPDAYGGTALLRGAAALPGILPRVLPDSLIQTVHVNDLARAVVVASRGELPRGTVVDVTAEDAHSLPDLTRAIRRWQGLPEARLEASIPSPLLGLVGRLADACGRLGWRSPLRTTALATLRDGVRGDAAPARVAGLPACRDLNSTLASLPSTRQERLYARLYFVLPASIAILSIFWVISGLLALAQPSDAARVLEGSSLPPWAILSTVIGGGLVDILLGIAILWRRWCRTAALGMIAVAMSYLLGGLLFAPGLWVDPLGPMIKVLPSIALALIVWLGVEDR